jgi:AmmeMemoRadiSam system protein B
MSGAVDRVREPAVAGRFYPGSAAALSKQVAQMSGVARSDRAPALATIGPHAGYVYSGAIAAQTYAGVEVPPRVILLGPNHTGRGAARSLWGGSSWRIPGHEVPIDHEMVGRLRGQAGLVLDLDAHAQEHSLEVHVPFLLHQQPALRLTPICLGRLGVEACRQLGNALADAIREAGPAMLAVSTDMSHYLSADEARVLDGLALERVRALDPEGLHRVVRERGISMCGFIPTTVALFAARRLGATSCELIRYGHSGETSGDHDRVVGYAGLVVR